MKSVSSEGHLETYTQSYMEKRRGRREIEVTRRRRKGKLKAREQASQ